MALHSKVRSVDFELEIHESNRIRLESQERYFEYPEEAFTWRMAGKELSFIKAWSIGSIGGARTISPLFYANMKPKLTKHFPV